MPRAARSQVNCAARARPAVASRSAADRLGQEVIERGGDRVDVQRVEVADGVAADLRERRGVRASNRHTARHRLEHRKPEAFRQRRKGEHARRGVEALEVRIVDPAQEPDPVCDSELACLPGKLVLEDRPVPREDERRDGPRFHSCDSREQARQVLPCGRRAERDKINGASPRASRARSSGSGVARPRCRPPPLGTASDTVRRDAERRDGRSA